MVDNISVLENANGQQAIPFMQVVLMLTSDLDGTQESDQAVMQKLLTALIDRLEISPSVQLSNLSTRTSKSEVQLVILRMLCVLMGKVKSSSKTTTSILVLPSSQKDNASFVASATANALLDCNAIQFCLVLLKSFLPYWKGVANSEEIITTSSGILTTTSSSLLPVEATIF